MKKKNHAAIRVLIADSYMLIREGVKHIFQTTQDIHLVASVPSGLEAIKLCRTLVIHLLVMDIDLPDKNGIDVLKQIKKEFPHLHILILSFHKEEQYAIRCLKAGASGFLNKRTSAAELIEAIRQIASGEKYIGKMLAQILANQIDGQQQRLPHETLSDREYQTMIMIASGKTVGDIAKELVLSVKTISMYRTRALTKMQLKHNAELTYYAIKHHLVE